MNISSIVCQPLPPALAGTLMTQLPCRPLAHLQADLSPVPIPHHHPQPPSLTGSPVLLLETTLWSGPASSASLILSQPGSWPSSCRCFRQRLERALSVSPLGLCTSCSTSVFLLPHSSPGDSAQGLLPPGSHLFQPGGIRGLSCVPTDPWASVGHGHCLSLHKRIVGVQSIFVDWKLFSLAA